VNLLEFIIRMKDEASAGIRRVREELKGTKEQAEKTQPGLEGFSGTVKGFGESFNRAKGALLETAGVITTVYAAFRLSYTTFKPIGESIRDLYDPTRRLSEQWKELSERISAAAKILSLAQAEQREKIDALVTSHDRLSKAAADEAKQQEALAAASRKANDAISARRLAQIDTNERQAVAMGYDPDAVRVVYADERRRAQADSAIASAQGDAAQAQRGLESAEKQAELAVNRSLALQDALNEAEAQKIAARKLLADAQTGIYTDAERTAKIQAALLADRKAEIAMKEARGALTGAQDQESAAADAVAVARAQAAAAAEGVKTAEMLRANAEQEYQADVKAFWDDRDRADEEAQAAELQAVREQAAERKRLTDEAVAAEHQARLDAIRDEVSVSEQSQAAAQSRLDRARSAAQQAWSWYRDPESFRRQLDEEKANAEAEKRFQRDAASLTSRTGWRTRTLDADQEAVRRVVLAREEERRSEAALVAIEQNTAGLKDMLQMLLTSK